MDKLDYRLDSALGEVDDGKGQGAEDHPQHPRLDLGCYEHRGDARGYISRNPCRRVQLPGIEKAKDEAMFLTHAEFSPIREGWGERYKAFTHFLVMTGTRFGEATALTVADVDLGASPVSSHTKITRTKNDPS